MTIGSGVLPFQRFQRMKIFGASPQSYIPLQYLITAYSRIFVNVDSIPPVGFHVKQTEVIIYPHSKLIIPHQALFRRKSRSSESLAFFSSFIMKDFHSKTSCQITQYLLTSWSQCAQREARLITCAETIVAARASAASIGAACTKVTIGSSESYK